MSNPNHDPENGQFTDGEGGGGATGDKSSDHAIAGKVDPHVRRLESSLGKDEHFKQVIAELRTNKEISQAHAVEISRQFTGAERASTPRSKALDNVEARHNKLMRFKNDLARGVGSKSAG